MSTSFQDQLTAAIAAAAVTGDMKQVDLLTHVLKTLSKAAPFQAQNPVTRSSNSSQQIKVIFCSASGTGKSFNGNVLAQRNVFKSVAQVARGTAVVQATPLAPAPPLFPDVSAANTLIVDAPGLSEASSANTEQNAAELVKALRLGGDTVICYLIGCVNLRPSHDDLNTVRDVRRFLLTHGVTQQALSACEVAVLNNYDWTQPAAQEPEFVQEVTSIVRNSLQVPFLRIGFVPRVDAAKASDYRADASLAASIPLRQVLSLAVPAAGFSTLIKTDAELRTEQQEEERKKAEAAKKLQEEQQLHRRRVALGAYVQQYLQHQTALMNAAGGMHALLCGPRKFPDRSRPGVNANGAFVAALQARSRDLANCNASASANPANDANQLIGGSNTAKAAYRAYLSTCEPCLHFGPPGGGHRGHLQHLQQRNNDAQQHMNAFRSALAQMDAADNTVAAAVRS